jgi:DNA-binding transcriptional ArsR family regulator
MTVDIENELVKHREKVKTLVQLTTSGDVILKQTGLTAKQKILITLIGRVYSKFAGYSDDCVTNRELVERLGLPEGTMKYTLHELRKEGLVMSLQEGVHQIRMASIGLVLDKYFKGGDNGERNG